MIKKINFYNFNIVMHNNILLIIYFLLFFCINCRVIIPFKYIQEKTSDIPTPKEIMLSYMSQIIYINLEIGSPKQQVLIPLKFNDNLLYIVNKQSNKNKFDETKSSTFKIISEDYEISYNYDFTMYQNCSDIFHFLKKMKKENIYTNNLNFILTNEDRQEGGGGFGLQLYNWKDQVEKKMPVPLNLLKENHIIDNYLWSIYFNKKGNIIGDEGILILGEYPHNLDFSLEIYDKDEFDKDNFRKVLEHSNQKRMNYDIQMSEIYFYNKESKKDKTNQNFFNDLQKEEFFSDIVIPQVSSYYMTKFDYNFAGILIPEYFNQFLEKNVFDSYIKSQECFTEKVNNYKFFYCTNKNSVIKKIKKKIPTVLFIQENLKYNFTININDLIYEKDNYIYFLLFYSTSQKNKWTLGKPFLKKYPLVFNPYDKEIGFYSSFLLTGIKYRTFFIIIIIVSIIFIIIGLLIGRKKYKIYKIKKSQALEMSNNNFISDYKSIEMNNEMKNKLYSE